ncbi:MAG: non-canonical purine NTP pyrophosphatase [Ignavibacteriae bacterium]|nr:non-canonical purine NTP pyrophosphatase [Ignavibacteriota bacterium]
MKILIATNNKHKVAEIKYILNNDNFELLTLLDLNINIEVEEDKDTLEGNALKKTYDDNCQKLLECMKNIPESNRNAYFKTVVCFYESENKYHLFDGICNGHITTKKYGEKGFGYDPLFIPDGFKNTYAEMSDEEKNSISHRGKAFEKAGMFLLKKYL